MPDLPERVDLTSTQRELLGFVAVGREALVVIAVLQAKLLDAERERDVLAKQLNPVNDGNGGNNRGNGGNNLHVYVERFPTAKQLEWDSRVEWFLETGDVKQWSGPNGENPLPQMREDFKGYIAALRAQVAALTAERDALAKGILNCGAHDSRCDANTGDPCDCGLDGVFTLARAILGRVP